MIPLQRFCDVENLADFGRYYASSWVGWHGEDENHIKPCFVGHPLDGAHIQLRPLARGENNQLVVTPGFVASWADIKARMDFGVPDVGMMPDGPTVLFLSHSTPRAAKKGYRSRDAQITDFNSWDIRRKYNPRNPADNYSWTWFAFNPEYKTLLEAEDVLAKGEAVGIPLSRTLAVYSTPKFKNSLLAYKRWTVGHVISPYLIQIKREYADYEEDIARQTGAEVIVG
jgi:hypothetical protein